MRSAFNVPGCSLAIALVVLSPVDASAQTVPQQPMTMEQLEKMMLDSHPATVERSVRADAARSRAQQAGAFPNPEIGYVGEEIPLQGDTPGGRHGFFVEQVIPLGGKRGLSRTVFEQETRRLEASVNVARQALLVRVRQLAYSAAGQ